MKKLLILAVVSVALLSCTNAKEATRVLQAQGFKNIEITGYNFFGCGKGDKVHTGFTAVGLDGQRIEGTVCSGLIFKGSTVRF